MRIVHVAFGLGIGGIETMLVNIVNAQVEEGNDVHILIINDVVDSGLRNQLDERIHFHCLGRKAGSHNPWTILRLNYWLYTLHADIIHSHNSSLWKFLWFPCLRNHKGLCVTQHDVFESGEVRDLERFQHIFSISKAVQESILKGKSVKSQVIYNGIHTESFQVKSEQAHQPFRMVQISRLRHDKKGQDFLIARTAALIRQGMNLDLTLIGDGESRAFLESMISDLHVEDHIHLLGSCTPDYIAEHLCDYDLLVQPSRFEGFGLTVAEAMAANVPVLVSNIEGPMEIIEDGRYGHSFPVDDEAAFDAQLKTIVGHYSSALEKANHALLMVRERYDVAKTAYRYLQQYDQIIN